MVDGGKRCFIDWQCQCTNYSGSFPSRLLPAGRSSLERGWIIAVGTLSIERTTSYVSMIRSHLFWGTMSGHLWPFASKTHIIFESHLSNSERFARCFSASTRHSIRPSNTAILNPPTSSCACPNASRRPQSGTR